MTSAYVATVALLLGACAVDDPQAALVLDQDDAHDHADGMDERLSRRVGVCHVDQVTGDWSPVQVDRRLVQRHLDLHGDWLIAEAEICWDDLDDDCDGVLDNGCNGCDVTVTRPAPWWASAACALAGDLGVDPFPVSVGSSLSFDDGDEVMSFLAIDPAGDGRLRLQRQLVALRLNIAFFGVADHPAVDLDGDGYAETFAQLATYGDSVYDTGSNTRMAQTATKLRSANWLAYDMELWFDETCEEATVCGYDDDDDLCGCVEVCDGIDNNRDGVADEGCD